MKLKSSDNKLTYTAAILNAISDDKSLALFDTIALADCYSDILLTKTKLTRTQYYSRISSLIKDGLVKRKNGKYCLTSLGKVVYNAKTIIDGALNHYWKLKAIDSLELANDNLLLTKEEFTKLVDSLIDNQKIKGIITKSF
jgi:hypothetical protein